MEYNRTEADPEGLKDLPPNGSRHEQLIKNPIQLEDRILQLRRLFQSKRGYLPGTDTAHIAVLNEIKSLR